MLHRSWGGKKPQKQKKTWDIYLPGNTRQKGREPLIWKSSCIYYRTPQMGHLEELRNPGTDCMKSFELHKMLMVALSQASCWQLLRVSNNSSKISIHSLSLFSDPVCSTVPQIIHMTVFALFMLLTLNCAYKQVYSDFVKHSEHRKPDVQPQNSVVFNRDAALYK